MKVVNIKAERRKAWLAKNMIKTVPSKPTLRYCLICKKNTWFKLDHNQGHSACNKCGKYRSTKTK